MKKKLLFFMLVLLVSTFFISTDVFSNEVAIINIDVPVENDKLGDSVFISGWTLSDYPNTKVKVSIDNKSMIAEKAWRNDVLKAYKNYDNSNNVQPGFIIKSFDIKDLDYGSKKMKVELLSEDDKIISTKEISVIKKAPSTLINIDSPYSSGGYSNSVLVSGWVMSEASGTEVKASIDGGESISLDRWIRTDVYSVKGYGDASTNPTPGFVKNIDISEFEFGTHTLKIEVVNDSGEVISTSTTKFTKKAPSTLISIDSPYSSGKYNDSVLVSGWVMSEASGTEVKASIDGGESINLDRWIRTDVYSVKGYGDASTNPTPGFVKNIDISKLNYGMHTVKIEVFDKTNKIIENKEIQFNISKPLVLICIDTPFSNTKVSKSMTIGGWIMSDSSNISIHLLKDNEDLGEITRTYGRGDVLKAVKGYGDISTNPTPGFSKEVDLSEYKDGNITLTIDVRDKNGISIEKQSVTVKLEKYKTTINSIMPIENTVFSDQILTGEGTIITDAPNPLFNAYIDDEKIDTTFDGTNYNYIYDKLYDKKDGNHLIKLEVISNEEVIKTKEIVVNVKKKYDGTACIDYIDRGNVGTIAEAIKNDGAVTITGWVLTNDAKTNINNEIKVFIDGIERTEIVNREDRGDLYIDTSPSPKYVDPYTLMSSNQLNPMPGFAINVNGLSNGNHTVVVKMYNHLGEEIGYVSRIFQLYSGYSRGIDVSKFQSNIDWNTVKNSGIDFVIIRAAYRGFGDKGTLVYDDLFPNHIMGAYNAGLKVGLYFFSQAKDYNEGVEEAHKAIASLTLSGVSSSMLDKTIPIAIDVEKSSCSGSECPGRADNLTLQQRTDAVSGFVNTIKNVYHYKTMIYASTSWIYGEGKKIDLNQIDEDDVWLADWRTGSPEVRPDYPGRFGFWQWGIGGRGNIPGIPGINSSGDADNNGIPDIDLDIRYE